VLHHRRPANHFDIDRRAPAITRRSHTRWLRSELGSKIGSPNPVA
jgi:hypothetical protein